MKEQSRGGTAQYRWAFRASVNGQRPCAQMGLRAWIAVKLRQLAQTLDNRRAIVIEMESDPTLPQPEMTGIVRAGLDHMARLHAESTENAAKERVLEATLPELFSKT